MKIILRDIRLSPTDGEEAAKEKAKEKIKRFFPSCPDMSLCSMSVYKRSVDARHRSSISVVWSICVDLKDMTPDSETLQKLNAVPDEAGGLDIVYGNENPKSRPLVAGFGPCGMFCALLLAENGYRPVVIERGLDIENRRRKVDLFCSDRILDTECNIQFGAGGAGTFSDGKLVTRINDKKCGYVLKTLHEYGAPDSILTEAKPHIGTDRLGGVVQNIADRIVRLGGEIHYGTRLDSYTKKNGELTVKTNRGDFVCSSLVLALGHSARDTFKSLASIGLDMIPKPFSVGVRIEQLQKDINNAIYGKYAAILGQADYNFSYRNNEHAVYTFCMCPGGEVAAAASGEGGVVVNGMSNYMRDGKNSNSALVVSVSPCDYGNGLFDGMAFQSALEKKAYEMGGRNYNAPVQTVSDYFAGRVTKKLGRISPTYMRGDKYTFCDLNALFPSFINDMLKEGITRFEKKVNGFAPADAVLSGAETRTSSSVRLPRNELLVSVGDGDVYPGGEGAGYAGGITSASVDGVRIALEIMKRYKPFD